MPISMGERADMASLLKQRPVYLMVASVLTFVIGIIISSTTTLPDIVLIFPLEMSLFLMTVAIFAFGFIFFGFPAPLIMFFFGIYSRFRVAVDDQLTIGIFASVFCAFLACYASVKLGDALLLDMAERGNFRKVLKISVIVLFVALLISVVIDSGVVT